MSETKKSVIEERQSTSYQAREKAREIGMRILKILLKDPLAWFLLIAAAALLFTFFTLLGQIQPSSPGAEASLTQVTQLTQTKQVKAAVLLNEDNRIVLQTKDGQTLWAAYPSSGANTGTILTRLQQAGASAGEITRALMIN